MNAILESDALVVSAKSLGAELTSIQTKKDGCEYLWQGDPAFWAGQSPLLFPIVGVVKDNQYRFAGSTYALGGHGFARKEEFEATETGKQSVTFRLADSEETRAVYPFRFALEVTYSVEGNVIGVRYRVHNTDDKTIHFSIGGHPAFNCPLNAGENFEDYYLEFDHPENLARQFIGEGGLMEDFTEQVLRNESIILLKKGMFDRGAWVLENYRSSSLALRGRHTDRAVKVDFPGFPQLGVWSRPNAPYVCIEPWFGINDLKGTDGDLTQKKGILHLEQGKIFSTRFTITIE